MKKSFSNDPQNNDEDEQSSLLITQVDMNFMPKFRLTNSDCFYVTNKKENSFFDQSLLMGGGSRDLKN